MLSIIYPPQAIQLHRRLISCNQLPNQNPLDRISGLHIDHTGHDGGGVFVVPFSGQRSENEIDLPDIPFVVIGACNIFDLAPRIRVKLTPVDSGFAFDIKLTLCF